MDLLVETVDLAKLQATLNTVMENLSIQLSANAPAGNFCVRRLPFSASQLLYMNYSEAIRVKSAALKSVLIVFPVAGGLTQRLNGMDIKVLPGDALVVSPGDRLNMQWLKKTEAFLIHVPDCILFRYWVDYFDGNAFFSVRFSPVLSCVKYPGRNICKLIADIMIEMGDVNSLISRGIALDAVENRLILTLLDSLRMNHPEETGMCAESFKPIYIKRVLQYIMENERENISMADLATVAGVSPRTLQLGFDRVYGIPPMSYVRRYKLVKVRHVLKTLITDNVVIGDIAAKWGFFHSSNFARNYKELFGECPSATVNKRLAVL
jgi:AraC-like DNA-binding protein